MKIATKIYYYEDEGDYEDSSEEISLEDELYDTLELETEDDDADNTPEAHDEVVDESTEPEIDENLKIKIKVNGEEKEVPLSELKNGYQRQADYTHKTQELSQERQQVEAEKQKYEQYISSIPVLANVAYQNAQQAQEQLYSPEMIQLAQTNPAEYVAQKANLERTIMENNQSLQAMGQHYEAYQNETQAAEQQRIAAETAETHEIMHKKYGEDWQSGKLFNECVEYGKKAGISTEEIAGLTNHKHIDVLISAAKYDQLISGKAAIAKKVEKIPPKLKTISNDSDEANDDDYKKREKRAIVNARKGEMGDLEKLIEENFL